MVATAEMVDRIAEQVDALTVQVKNQGHQLQQQGYQIFALTEALQEFVDSQNSSRQEIGQLVETLKKLTAALQSQSF